MRLINQLPKSLVLFWLIQIVIISGLWDLLPSRSIGSLLIVLVATNGVLIYLKQFELPIFSTVALALVGAHFWLGDNYTSPLMVSLFIFGLISTIGLISAGSNHPIKVDDLLAWSVVGLFTAQIATLTQFWPISSFQKSMLGTIIFYLIWQSWLMIDSASTESTDTQLRRSFWWHFIFVGMAVMVVVVNIIWTTWPGLKTF